MLWTLLKIILFFAAAMGLATAANNLLGGGEGLPIQVGDMSLVLSPFQMVIAALVLFLAVWLALKVLGVVVAFIRFLLGDTTAMTRYFDRNREKRGYQALAEGMLAVASGEGKQAQAQAAKAAKYLPRPEIASLLKAQAAETAGDDKAASEAYKALIADDRTKFVGVRGLMRQQLASGDTETALALAAKAYAIKPRDGEVQDALLTLNTERGNWADARRVLDDKRRDGRLPKDVFRRRDAVMALEQARGIIEEGASVEAREAAIAANKKSPDLIPAAVMAARSYIASGESRKAARILHKAWAAQPHPELAATYAEIAPDETPQARVRRFGSLIGQNRKHVESKLLEAELHLAAEDFPAARRAMKGVIEDHPTARAMTIMAAIERGEGAEDQVVRGWLARALTAPRGPQWVCDNCQNVMAEWAPSCDSCQQFDTLTWREPPGDARAAAQGAEMLPLIVGQIEGPKEASETPAPESAPEAPATKPEAAPHVPHPDHKPGYIDPEPGVRAKPSDQVIDLPPAEKG